MTQSEIAFTPEVGREITARAECGATISLGRQMKIRPSRARPFWDLFLTPLLFCRRTVFQLSQIMKKEMLK